MAVAMKRTAALAALLSVRSAFGLSFDVEAAKNRPVSKVITLLKDMLAQLEKEAKEDEEIYDKMACWCETNDKEKTQAISDAEARIEDLGSKIEQLTAQSARLATEIESLKKEVASNQESLDQATALRTKQLASFNGEEKEMLQSIKALEAAVVVLSKHHSSFFVQVSSGLIQVATTIQHELQAHASLLEGVLTPSERDTLQEFIQAPTYQPQSAEIYGILRQMKETFESDLSASQKEELANQKAFEELKSAKEEEIQAGQAQIDTKTQELATTDEKNVQAKQDIEDTKGSLSADEQFLMMLKEKCSMTDKEWEERQKTRNEEIEAVSKALSILSSDAAHDTFTKTFNPAASFLQESKVENSEDRPRREKAASMLSKMAKQTHNPRLATLAVRVRLDAFEKVKKAIDDMVAQLIKDKQDEIKHKDFCVDEQNTNQIQTERKEREKEDFIAKISDLEMTIDQTAQAITDLQAAIAEMQVQLKRAGEDREKQNREFQSTVSDQRETQKLLQAALGVLKETYAPALVQSKQEPAGPPPPAGFETYEKSSGSSGVLSLLEQIISDAKAMENEALRSENDAQKAYEDFVKDTNGSVSANQKDIINKSEVKAKAEADLVKAKEGKESVVTELEQLSNYNAELHQSCDFILKNFEVRQEARDEEIEALKQAKAILSGANFGEFLQRA